MSHPRVYVQARIPLDDLEFFEQNFPGQSKQGFIEACFMYLRQLSVSEKIITGNIPALLTTAHMIVALEEERNQARDASTHREGDLP